MKCVHSDANASWWITGCPECDLPLIVQVPAHVRDPLFWRLDDENSGWLDFCPRCNLPLPALVADEGGRPTHDLMEEAA